MKRLFTIALVSAVVLSGCVKDLDEKPTNNKGNKIRLEASREGSATRVEIDGNNLLWQAGDALSVFDLLEQNNEFTIQDGTGTTVGVFDGTADDAPYYALYPYQSGATISGTTITAAFPVQQTLAVDVIDAQSALMVGFSNAGTEFISFHNAFAVLKLSVTGTVNLTGVSVRSLGTEKLSGTVTVDAASATPSLTFDASGADYIVADAIAPIALSSTAQVLYVVIPAQSYAAGLEINFKTDEGVLTRNTKAALTVARNSVVTSPATAVIPVCYDLSTAGGTEPQETSNSYVIDPVMIALYGNNYRFPANVMGNGVWGNFADENATDNTPANNTAGEVFTLSDPAGTQAELLWQEAPNTISNLSLSNNYITFTVSSSVKGNASIAATDGGVIKWSWHIWIPRTVIKAQTYPVTSGTAPILQDRNLGALSAERPSVKYGSDDSYGLYYQFGRKDPFPRMSHTGSSTVNYMYREIYDANGTLMTSMTTNQDLSGSGMVTNDAREWQKFNIVVDNSVVQGSIDDAIQHPLWFFAVSSSVNKNHWYKAGYNFVVSSGTTNSIRNVSLWDARATPNNNKNTKSAFDPCPRGWQVPSRNTLTNTNVTLDNAEEYNSSLTNTDLGIRTNDGFTFTINSVTGEKSWYPATGFIQYTVSSGAPTYTYSYRAIMMYTCYEFTGSNSSAAGFMLRFNNADAPGNPLINNSPNSTLTASGNPASGINASRPAYGNAIRCLKK